ncbi:MAG: sensor histidine kinase [Gaiellaceae bacterium]
MRLIRTSGNTALHALAIVGGLACLAAGGRVAVVGLTAALVAGGLIHGASQVRLRREKTDAEVRYRNLVEKLPLITYIDSPRHERRTAAYVSPQIESILGYPVSAWQSDPQAFPRHLHPDDRERVLDAQQAARDSGEPLDIEYRVIARDGHVVWLRDSYMTMRDATGEPWYTQGFAVDITARKLAEHDREELLRQTQLQNEQLRRLDRMKDEFIALVSHELRTPLTSIRGYLELLVEEVEHGGIAEPQSEWLGIIDRNSERLSSLVEDLLLAAQAEDGNLHLNPTTFDLGRMLDDCLRAAAAVAAGGGIELTHTIGEVAEIRGDPTRVAQVVDNLLSNALKFTPAGGRVEVRASRHGRFVRIEVADSGMGIAADEQPQLFTRFFRTERAQLDAIVGAGLGLSIAKAIVDAHDGSIGFRSEEGVGTTFVVELPVAGPIGEPG